MCCFIPYALSLGPFALCEHVNKRVAMSSQKKNSGSKMTISDLQSLYSREEKITVLTAYDYTMARMADDAGVDIVLVGDSLGMVIQGEDTTLPVDIEHMVYHTRCVAKGIKRAHLMADMPFMSYQPSLDVAVSNAGSLIKAGAASVKLEGGEEMADLVWYLDSIGIPVCAHIGLKPQSIHKLGGYKVQGRSKLQAEQIVADAKILEEAGAFSLLLEGIPLEVAREITQTVAIPTIGIGSGPYCSGQVLVCYDVLGADPDFEPRFVKKYLNLHEQVTQAFSAFAAEVKAGQFPSDKHCFHQNVVAVKAIK